MDDLDRLYQRTLQNIRARSPEYLRVPFTVAQLYERIVPYRHYRRELGIETNQDYEVALTRLLAGERGYVRGDLAMQERLQQELASPNPDPGAFREFGSAQLWIAAPEQEPDGSSTAGAVPATPPMTTAPAAATAIATPATHDSQHLCMYCGGALPGDRVAVYCPHCGQNLSLARCPACGAEVDASWNFCINCGRKARE